VKTETLLSSVIFKTIMVPLHGGSFLVVHLYSRISMDPKIFPQRQICTKNYKFWWFWEQ